ncbi:MAG: methyltransferase domain-containing protein [Rhizobiales bacterium]|nr:methyltransferase domain-containing protein [Hyphomicrobiales bacterium]
MDRLLRVTLSRLIRAGDLRVTTAHGTAFAFGDRTGTPVAVRFTSGAWQLAVIIDPELRLGEAYMNGGIVVEQGSLADFLDLIVKNISRAQPSVWRRLLANVRSAFRRTFLDNNLWRSRRNARHHYNIDYRIYRLFLDSDLQYSCAYFEHENASLEEAQFAKKKHIASKLLLKPKQKVLDIGSGWGGLGLHLARSSNVSVVGINLSEEQVKIARHRAEAEGLPCEFRIQDYRLLSEQFDRIVSVGMFEHVGKRHYDTFFKKCHDLLTDDGVMMLHTIGRWSGPSDTNAWVWRYVFPGGYTPALSEIAPSIERSGLIISDIEVLRIHYAETLRAWRTNFLANRQEVVRLFKEDAALSARFGNAERFIRMWEYYLAGFEASFRYYGLVVFQIQLSKSIDSVPLTRSYMYRDKDEQRSNLKIAAAAE